MIYAVNKWTKEHIFVKTDGSIPSLCDITMEWRTVEADADGWIEWSGGECPLPDNHPYEAKCKTGRAVEDGRFKDPQNNRAWDHYWGIQEGCYKIIAYRPIIDHPASEEPKEWRGPQDGTPPIGIEVEIRRNDDDWQRAIVVGHHGCRVVVALWGDEIKYDWAVGAGVRPIRTDRDRWIEAANKLWNDGDERFTPDFQEDVFGRIYDALASGELEPPARN